MGLRAILMRIEEAKRAPANEPSRAWGFLVVVQEKLKKLLEGWTFSIEGHRAGTMRGAPKGADEFDEYTLHGNDADRMNGAKILLSSLNDAQVQHASLNVYGARDAGGMMIKRKYENVKKGDDVKVVSDIIAALKKAGSRVAE